MKRSRKYLEFLVGNETNVSTSCIFKMTLITLIYRVHSTHGTLHKIKWMWWFWKMYQARWGSFHGWDSLKQTRISSTQTTKSNNWTIVDSASVQCSIHLIMKNDCICSQMKQETASIAEQTKFCSKKGPDLVLEGRKADKRDSLSWPINERALRF